MSAVHSYITYSRNGGDIIFLIYLEESGFKLRLDDHALQLHTLVPIWAHIAMTCPE